MDELLKKLDELYQQGSEMTVYDESDDSCYFVNNELKDTVEDLCCDYLITSQGQCNWINIAILQNNGYRVFAGDKDSFGWLVGCVQREGDQRIVTYG